MAERELVHVVGADLAVLARALFHGMQGDAGRQHAGVVGAVDRAEHRAEDLLEQRWPALDDRARRRQAREILVEELQTAGLVGDPGGARDVFEEGHQALVAPLQLALALDLLGDVLGAQHHAARPGHRQLAQPARPDARHVDRELVDDGALVQEDFPVALEITMAAVDREQLADRLPDHVGRVHRHQPPALLVDMHEAEIHHLAGRVVHRLLDEQRVEVALGCRAEPLLALQQFRLRLLARRDVLAGDHHAVGHGRDLVPDPACLGRELGDFEFLHQGPAQDHRLTALRRNDLAAAGRQGLAEQQLAQVLGIALQ